MVEQTDPPSSLDAVPVCYPQQEDEQGDVLIRGFWAHGTDCIVDVRITNTNAKTYRSKDPTKILAQHKQEKKKKYLEACLERRCHFTLFVVSADGKIGKEAKVMMKRLPALLADKWQKSYSEVCGYVNARMSIVIVRATHLCLGGSRIPASRISTKRVQWEDSASLGLFQT
jgi:hypothetical protein